MLAVVGLVATFSSRVHGHLPAFLHLLAYAAMVGSNMWNTFFVGLGLFQLLPRQTFGRVQSVLFPK